MADAIAPAKLPDHEARLNIARAVSEYLLRDAEFADDIVDAYCNPEQADEHLRQEQS